MKCLEEQSQMKGNRVNIQIRGVDSSQKALLRTAHKMDRGIFAILSHLFHGVFQRWKSRYFLEFPKS